MTSHQAQQYLQERLAEDIESVRSEVQDLKPSDQRRLVAEAFRLVAADQVREEDKSFFLAILQILLAASEQYLDSAALVNAFETTIAQAATAKTADFRDRAYTVSALVLSRLRDPSLYLSPETNAHLDAAVADETSTRRRQTLLSIVARLQIATARWKNVQLRSRRKFAIPPLNYLQAAKNVRGDIHGDWYQDPWGWPEIEWLGSEAATSVAARLEGDKHSWTLALDVPKKNGGVRPGLLLNPLDRIAFQALVDELSLEAAGHLPEWVHGWRLARIRPEKGHYEPNREEWDLFSRRVNSLCKTFAYTAHLDIQSFFATVDTSQTLAVLGRRYRNAAVIDRLETFFNAWHACPNGAGLPQRSLASSIIAHTVLRPLDAYLDRLTDRGHSKAFAASRWMDDIWIHGDNEDELRSCVSELENLLSSLKLSLNAEKSLVFASAEADKLVQLVDVSAADSEDETDTTVDEVLINAEDVPPFWTRRKLFRLLKRPNPNIHTQFDPERFHEFTYLASTLAPLFRTTGDWKRFSNVYLKLANRCVSQENLTVVIWAAMFPSSPEHGIEPVRDYFIHNMFSEPLRLLTPLAAQRLTDWASWVDAISAPQNQEDQFRLRGVNYAALNIEGLSNSVSRITMELGDEVTHAFLKSRNFAPISVIKRFRD
jgi:hypothetical protein